MSGVFEGSIQSKVGKKTKRMKWKITMSQVNKTDLSLKIDADMNGKPQKADLLIHNNPNRTIDVDGYVLNGKKRRPVTIKNMELTENAMKEQLPLLLV
jgi:hypothetical protein